MICSVLAIICAFPAFFQRVHAADSLQTVKVGFFAFDGYHMQDEDGTLSGYGYEFLQHLAGYAGLRYAFVGYDKSWSEMPVMDGFEATAAIRGSAHPEARTVQIIAQTADAFNEDITKALSCGMNAHVAKPINPDALAKALAKAFKWR